MRVADTNWMPKAAKPVPDLALAHLSGPQRTRELLEDGTCGGAYQISDRPQSSETFGELMAVCS